MSFTAALRNTCSNFALLLHQGDHPDQKTYVQVVGLDGVSAGTKRWVVDGELEEADVAGVASGEFVVAFRDGTSFGRAFRFGETGVQIDVEIPLTNMHESSEAAVSPTADGEFPCCPTATPTACKSIARLQLGAPAAAYSQPSVHVQPVVAEHVAWLEYSAHVLGIWKGSFTQHGR